MSDGGLSVGRLLHVPAKPGVDSLPIEITLSHERDDDLVVLTWVASEFKTVHAQVTISSCA